MRQEEYMKGILGALRIGEDNGVPVPVWRYEEYLKMIYDAIKGGSLLPSVTASDNGKLLGVVDGAWGAVSIPPANGEDF